MRGEKVLRHSLPSTSAAGTAIVPGSGRAFRAASGRRSTTRSRGSRSRIRNASSSGVIGLTTWWGTYPGAFTFATSRALRFGRTAARAARARRAAAAATCFLVAKSRDGAASGATFLSTMPPTAKARIAAAARRRTKSPGDTPSDS